jgi:hypothetical protein
MSAHVYRNNLNDAKSDAQNYLRIRLENKPGNKEHSVLWWK